MKKGQKQLFKFINKIFENAIILQQLKIDELKIIEKQKSKSGSEQKFASGGVIVGEKDKELVVKPNLSNEGKSLIERMEETLKDATRVKENEEDVNRRFKKPLIFAVDMGYEMEIPKEDCDCNACKIEREILKHANKNDV